MSTGILLAQATVGPEQRYTVVLKYSYRQNARMCMDSLQELYSTVQYNRLKQILAKSHAACVEL